MFSISQQENWNRLLKYKDDILKRAQTKVSISKRLEKRLKEEFAKVVRYHQETLYIYILIKHHVEVPITTTCKEKA